MIYPLNEKSLDCIRFNGFFLVLEGAVRSAKTITANVAFYRRILASRDSTFMLSGNTQGSVSRNVLDGDFGFIALTGGKARQRTDRDGNKFLLLPAPSGDKRGEIKIYYFGSDNEASYKKIRGLTLGGWMADEYNLHSRSFIENAEGRTIAAQDRFHIATLNPDVPGHWVYKKRVDKYMGMAGYKYVHFTLDDNPAISDERKAELKQQYTGVFYQRYILGMRVRAEGGCYPSFSEKNIYSRLPAGIKFVVIGADVGGHRSSSAFCATGYYVKDGQLCGVVVDDMRIDHADGSTDTPRNTSEGFVENFRTFVSRVQKKWKCIDCYFESGEQLLKNSCESLGIINVYNSKKSPIIDRIRFLDLMFSRDRFGIMDYCGATIEAVRSAVYDPKSQNEERLDNGTSNIDNVDAMEYSFTSMMEDF